MRLRREWILRQGAKASRWTGIASRSPVEHVVGCLDVVFLAGNARSLVANRGDLIGDLVQRGKSVGALVPDADYLPEVESLGIPIWKFSMRRAGISPRGDLATVHEIYQLLRAIQPRAVFCYTVKPIVYGAPVARLAGVPRVYSMVTGLGHTFTTRSARTRALRPVVTGLYRVGMRASTRVFFQNPDDQQEFLDRGMLRDRSKAVRVNGSGIDLQRFAQRPLPAGPPLFLFIGRLLTEKGIAEFCEAARTLAASHPEARFVAVGPHDPGLPHAVTAAALDGWKREGVVELVGGVKDVRPWLERCTVFVLPSYREGTPRSVLEAMSVGRPIVTTDAPGCRETVVEGLNGFLVPARQAAPLAAAMRRFLEQPALVQPMATASRRLAEDKYDVRKVNQILLEAMELA